MQAASLLGLQPLAVYCQQRLGNLTENLRIWRLNEIVVSAWFCSQQAINVI